MREGEVRGIGAGKEEEKKEGERMALLPRHGRYEDGRGGGGEGEADGTFEFLRKGGERRSWTKPRKRLGKRGVFSVCRGKRGLIQGEKKKGKRNDYVPP